MANLEIVSHNDRRELPPLALDKMADALVEAWRKGECRLVKQTLDGGGDDRMKIRWKRETLAKLLPTEQDYFKRFIGGLW
jgi:hypothetical protein